MFLKEFARIQNTDRKRIGCFFSDSCRKIMTGTVCDAGLHQTVDVVKLKHSLKEEVFLMNKRFECCEEHSSFRTWRESQVTGTSKKKYC